MQRILLLSSLREGLAAASLPVTEPAIPWGRAPPQARAPLWGQFSPLPQFYKQVLVLQVSLSS